MRWCQKYLSPTFVANKNIRNKTFIFCYNKYANSNSPNTIHPNLHRPKRVVRFNYLVQWADLTHMFTFSCSIYHRSVIAMVDRLAIQTKQRVNSVLFRDYHGGGSPRERGYGKLRVRRDKVSDRLELSWKLWLQIEVEFCVSLIEKGFEWLVGRLAKLILNQVGGELGMFLWLAVKATRHWSVEHSRREFVRPVVDDSFHANTNGDKLLLFLILLHLRWCQKYFSLNNLSKRRIKTKNKKIYILLQRIWKLKWCIDIDPSNSLRYRLVQG